MDKRIKRAMEKFIDDPDSDLAYVFEQAVKTQDLEEQQKVNAKLQAELNEFLQQRIENMSASEVWGKHVVDAAIQYIQQLEKVSTDTFLERLKTLSGTGNGIGPSAISRLQTIAQKERFLKGESE